VSVHFLKKPNAGAAEDPQSVPVAIQSEPTPSPSANPALSATLPSHQILPDNSAVTPESNADQDEDIAWLNINELEGAEADELSKSVDTCVERWRAAGPEARKKMFALFAIAGIFLSVCRHGHVLVMCDMIRSGELYDLHFF
jgi:hypothetical protein